MSEEAPSAAGARECVDSPVVAFTAAPGAGTSHLGGSAASSVVADLGEVVPASLGYGPPGSVAALPLDDPEAAERWARTACHLPSVSGDGVRQVQVWSFAEQRLPQDAGTAHWVCTRAETWRGDGSRAMTQFQGPTAGQPRSVEPGAVTGRAEEGVTCGPRSGGVLAGAWWRAPDDSWFLLAAGSEEITAITAEGEVSAEAEGRLLMVRSGERTETRITAELRDGGTLSALR